MKILSYGDNPKMSTGYGQIWDNLLTRWIKEKPDWEFLHVGWQNRDREHKTLEGYTMLPVAHKEYGYDTVVPYLLKYQPDILLTMADVGWQAGYVDSYFEAKRRGWKGKWVAYTPVDSDSWEHLVWNKILDVADINVAMSEWTEIIMKNHGVKRLKMIPLGVDTKIYKPIENRTIVRRQFNLGDEFVVGFVGRNQRRKMVANLIKGFAQFSKDKDNVKLLLHTDALPPQKDLPGWNISGLCEKFAQYYDPELTNKNKVVLTKENLDLMARQRIQPKNMNEIFNLMDIFCYATGGEGFGLPGLECQASGTPLMMTEYTTGFELCKDHGTLIPVLEDKYNRRVVEIGTNGIENAVPDDKEIARLLEEKYQDWKTGGSKLKEQSEKAREFSLKYDWDLISSQWINLFEENGL